MNPFSLVNDVFKLLVVQYKSGVFNVTRYFCLRGFILTTSFLPVDPEPLNQTYCSWITFVGQVCLMELLIGDL